MEYTTSFQVRISKKVLKSIERLPSAIQKKFKYLVDDLREFGPIRPNWPNYSKLERDRYHCHLSRSWVACWKNEKKTILIEIYYVGSREKAPY